MKNFNYSALSALILCFAPVGIDVAAQKPQPKVYMVSNAHLDTQWNWDIQTTIRDYVRNTMYQNLDLMKVFPDYIFNFEGAVKYAWMKEYYPERWDELCQRIKEGRWHLTGTSWDACETIICSPESWLRNTCMGQNYFRKEFGVESTDVFLPDCFGFPYTLPTLAAHCGLIGFSSQKLQWRTSDFYGKGKKYPYTFGIWEGIDGSKIMMAHGFGYTKHWNDEDLTKSEELLEGCARSPLNMLYRYYGTGDIGGSPDFTSARVVMEAANKKDADIKIINATSDQLYKDFLPFDAHKELPYFKGELTMDLHGNGCYTSEAAMKLYNRQNEHLGDAAERAAVIADWAGANAYPYNQLLDTWRKVIWHQFHDDLTGTSIPRAYEFSWNDELIALKSFSDVLTTSASAFASKLDTRVSGQPIVVYNAEAFDAVSVAQVDVPTADKSYIIKDSKGNTVPSQVVTDTKGKSHLLFEAKVPATGYAVFGMKEAGKAKALKVIEPKKIENECYAMTINDNGDITSLIDKKSNRQLVAEGKALRLVVFDKCESYDWPAWEIPKAIIDRAPVGIDGNVEVTKIEDGALRTTVKISKTYGESVINQFVTLWHGSLSNRIDFYNEVEWKSLNALLKAEFPLAAANEKASYDLGLGTIQRGNNCDNAFEVYSHEWTDLTDKSGKYGVTILNNCRYGWDKPNDNTLRLSLLYSPKPARSYTYQARQDIGYHEFTYSIISHEGDLNLADAAKQSAVLNSPLKAFTTTAHAGEMGKEFSFVSSDNENVIVRCVKRAENGNEYIIRVYELAGKTVQKANITFASDITKAEIADGTEKVIGEASFSGKTLQAEVRPFSVMTYRITLGKKAEASSTNGITIDLPYDKITASVNGFRSAANFADGYSYAAELLPEDNTLTSAGITFKLGDRLSRNGLVCKGNSFDIPEGCNKVYLLAASDDVDRKVTFTVGKTKQERNIPCYTGFIGQWGHDGHTIGFVKDADVAYIGSHRHSANGDEPYEYTYMFRIALDIPKGAKQVILPDNEHIVLFAATGVNETVTAKPASKFFTSSNLDDEGKEAMSGNESYGENLLKGARIVKASGFVDETESPEKLIDGRGETKWCDSQNAPQWIDIELGKEEYVTRWVLLNAGAEQNDYITRSCLLMGKKNLNDDWTILDQLEGNRKNKTNRTFTPQKLRYLRLIVTAPEQSEGARGAARLYELELYGK